MPSAAATCRRNTIPKLDIALLVSYNSMRHFILYIFICLLSLPTYAQTYDFSKDKDKILIKAQQVIRPVIGDLLFKNHFTIDTVDSQIITTIAYSQDFLNPKMLGIDTAFMIVFQIAKSSDTIGFISLYINKSGKLIYDSKDPLSYSTPELLVGYKRLLLNKFKIGFKEALAIAKKRGFQSTPFLTADTDYQYKRINKKTYVKVKYRWFVMDIESDKKPVTATLLINAETGQIEKEEYKPRMPG